jgi:tetratricopeptide (TPR) repeat protein
MYEELKAKSQNHSNRAMFLNNLGFALCARYYLVGHIDDLNAAVSAAEEAVKACTDNHPNRAMYLYNLGNALVARVCHCEEGERKDEDEKDELIDDLNAAVDAFYKAVKNTSGDHPGREMYLTNYGYTITLRIRLTGSCSVDELNSAISACEEAVKMIPDIHPNRVTFVSNLYLALVARLERSKLRDEMQIILDEHEKTLAAAPSPLSDPDRVALLDNVCKSLHRQFESLGLDDNSNELDEPAQANTNDETDNDNVPQKHPLSNSGQADMCKASQERLVQSGFSNSSRQRSRSDQPQNINNHSAAVGQTRVIDGLNSKIKALEDAVKSIPPNNPERPDKLNEFGNALRYRFKLTGQMKDLNRAIEVYEDATKFDIPYRMCILNNLGGALISRFEKTGSIDDFDRGIQSIEAAMESKPEESHRVSFADHLARALYTRFRITRSPEHLDKIVEIYRDIMRDIMMSTSEHDSNQAIYLLKFGVSLWERFEITTDIDDLNKAIQALKSAVQSLPQEDNVRVHVLNSLGCTLKTRFQWTGVMEDINEAVNVLRKAIEICPENDPQRPDYMSDLGNTLRERFERTGSVERSY